MYILTKQIYIKYLKERKNYKVWILQNQACTAKQMHGCFETEFFSSLIKEFLPSTVVTFLKNDQIFKNNPLHHPHFASGNSL